MTAGVLVLDGAEVALQHATLESYHDDTDWNLIDMIQVSARPERRPSDSEAESKDVFRRG